MRRKLAASSHSQALCALVFFYREVLGVPLGRLSAIRAKRPERLPTILSADEVRRILAILDRHPTHGLLAGLLYGCGLRVSEGCTLRVMDLDFQRRQILIRCAKGYKDRAKNSANGCNREVSRLTCSKAARTFARCKNCSDIRM